MSTRYSIRDLSQEFDITTRTIRFYEEKGLLSPTRQGQSRIFSNADRTRLKLILRGKRLGLTLEESSEIISMYEPQTGNQKQLETLIHKIQNKTQLLQQQQKDLELMILDLQESQERCQAALDANKKTTTSPSGNL